MKLINETEEIRKDTISYHSSKKLPNVVAVMYNTLPRASPKALHHQSWVSNKYVYL